MPLRISKGPVPRSLRTRLSGCTQPPPATACLAHLHPLRKARRFRVQISKGQGGRAYHWHCHRHFPQPQQPCPRPLLPPLTRAEATQRPGIRRPRSGQWMFGSLGRLSCACPPPYSVPHGHRPAPAAPSARKAGRSKQGQQAGMAQELAEPAAAATAASQVHSTRRRAGRAACRVDRSVEGAGRGRVGAGCPCP